MISLGPELCLRHKAMGLCHRRGAASPPRLLQRHNTTGLSSLNFVCAVPGSCVAGGGWMGEVGGGGLPRRPHHTPPATQNCGFASGRWGACPPAVSPALSLSRHVLLCHKLDVSAVSQSRHVCCVTQHTCLLCRTAVMSAPSHSGCACCVAQQTSAVSLRHFCCFAQQTCLLCCTTNLSAVSHRRHVCCITRQTCLPFHTAASPDK